VFPSFNSSCSGANEKLKANDLFFSFLFGFLSLGLLRWRFPWEACFSSAASFCCLWALRKGKEVEGEGELQNEHRKCCFRRRLLEQPFCLSVFPAVFACEKQLLSVRQRLPESCKFTASLQVVSSVVFFAVFAVLILGPPGGPLLLGKTLDTYSSECSAQEKLDRCVQSALFLGRQCDCLRRLRRK
jgi:hypothetical protein